MCYFVIKFYVPGHQITIRKVFFAKIKMQYLYFVYDLFWFIWTLPVQVADAVVEQKEYFIQIRKSEIELNEKKIFYKKIPSRTGNSIP